MFAVITPQGEGNKEFYKNGEIVISAYHREGDKY